MPDSTPPADDQAAYLADAEGLCRARTLPGDARGALDLLLAEYDRRGAAVEAARAASLQLTEWRAAERVERDVLSGLLRGMARRASRLRRQTNALIRDVRAVRALHGEIRVDDEGYRGCVHCGGDYPCDTLTALDGPTEAPTMRYELGCVVCATSPYFRLEPFESNDARQAWADAHQAATGHEEFRYRNTPVSVGPAEAAEPNLCECFHETSEHELDGNGQRTGACMVAITDVRTEDGKLVTGVIECPCEHYRPAVEAAEPAPAQPNADGRYDLDDVLTEAGIDPLLIGTHADPEFVAHQDHKHPVEHCGYCPTEDES